MDLDSRVKTILHFFPHAGFTPDHLDQAVREHPGADTVVASISRVREGHPLVERARQLGLNFIQGNCHAVEIYENGMPLAVALNELLPGVETYIFKERVTATPVGNFGSGLRRDNGQEIPAKEKGFLMARLIKNRVGGRIFAESLAGR